MKKLLPFLLLLVPIAVVLMYGQNKKPTSLREVLLAELRSTHNSEEWFVPANIAVKGLTAEQASWTDGKGNHSVGQLAHHLVFWNRQSLAKLKGENLKHSAATTMRPSINSTARRGTRRCNSSMK